MKKQLFTSILVFASVVIFAQGQNKRICSNVPPATEETGVAGDFTATFTDGTTFNLYTYLAASPNHYVYMDMFFVT